MKKLNNPWLHMEGYNCFGCAPNNQSGLKMDFYEDGTDVVCFWNPQTHCQGWINTLHGGIQASLLDEIAAWVVIKDLKTCGVTSKLEVRYLKPVPTNEGQLTIRARLKEMKRNIAIIECEIVSHKNEVCSRGEISYFTYSKEQSEKLFKFEDIN